MTRPSLHLTALAVALVAGGCTPFTKVGTPEGGLSQREAAAVAVDALNAGRAAPVDWQVVDVMKTGDRFYVYLQDPTTDVTAAHYLVVLAEDGRVVAVPGMVTD